MKTLTTLTAVAALVAGMSIANAQNSTGSSAGTTANPSNLNAAPTSEGNKSQSGMESKSAADAKVRAPVTTGSGGASNATPNDKSTNNGKTKADGLAK